MKRRVSSDMSPLSSRYILSVGVLVFLFVSAAAFAQAPAQSQSQAKNPKRQTVDFEDQLVQGEVKKPELFYLLQKKQFNFGKLIKLRENFIPEMTKTAEDIEKAK